MPDPNVPQAEYSGSVLGEAVKLPLYMAEAWARNPWNWRRLGTKGIVNPLYPRPDKGFLGVFGRKGTGGSPSVLPTSPVSRGRVPDVAVTTRIRNMFLAGRKLQEAETGVTTVVGLTRQGVREIKDFVWSGDAFRAELRNKSITMAEGFQGYERAKRGGFSGRRLPWGYRKDAAGRIRNARGQFAKVPLGDGPPIRSAGPVASNTRYTRNIIQESLERMGTSNAVTHESTIAGFRLNMSDEGGFFRKRRFNFFDVSESAFRGLYGTEGSGAFDNILATSARGKFGGMTGAEKGRLLFDTQARREFGEEVVKSTRVQFMKEAGMDSVAARNISGPVGKNSFTLLNRPTSAKSPIADVRSPLGKNVDRFIASELGESAVTRAGARGAMRAGVHVAGGVLGGVAVAADIALAFDVAAGVSAWGVRTSYAALESMTNALQVPKTTFGAGYTPDVMTKRAYTERERAALAIARTGLDGRQWMGKEAQLLHQ